jgi:hypothetical protein
VYLVCLLLVCVRLVAICDPTKYELVKYYLRRVLYGEYNNTVIATVIPGSNNSNTGHIAVPDHVR